MAPKPCLCPVSTYDAFVGSTIVFLERIAYTHTYTRTRTYTKHTHIYIKRERKRGRERINALRRPSYHYLQTHTHTHTHIYIYIYNIMMLWSRSHAWAQCQHLMKALLAAQLIFFTATCVHSIYIYIYIYTWGCIYMCAYECLHVYGSDKKNIYQPLVTLLHLRRNNNNKNKAINNKVDWCFKLRRK